MSSQDGQNISHLEPDVAGPEVHPASAAAFPAPRDLHASHKPSDNSGDDAIENAFVGDVADDAAEIDAFEIAEEQAVDELAEAAEAIIPPAIILPDAAPADGSMDAESDPAELSEIAADLSSAAGDLAESCFTELEAPGVAAEQEESELIEAASDAAADFGDGPDLSLSDEPEPDAESTSEPQTESAQVQQKPFWQGWMKRPGWLRPRGTKVFKLFSRAASDSAAEYEQVDEPDSQPSADVCPSNPEVADAVDRDTPSPGTPGEGWGEGSRDGASGDEAPRSQETLTLTLSRSTGRGDHVVRAPIESIAEPEEDFEQDEPDEPEPVTTGSTGGGWTIPLLCVGIATIACCLAIPQIDANRRLSYERLALRQDLESVQAQVATNDEFLRKLAGDPQLAERLAQRQLKLMRPGDKVLPIAQGDAGTSPFDLVHVAPPRQMPPYQPIGGKIATLCYNPRSRLYLMGGGLFLMAAGTVLGAAPRRE